MVTNKGRLCESCVFCFGTALYNIDRCDDCNRDETKHHFQADPMMPVTFEEVNVETVVRTPVKQKRGRK